MLELMKRLIAFKIGCKSLHWKTDNYGDHLLFDRLTENLDDMTDDIAEKYFMYNENTKELNGLLLEPKYFKDNAHEMIVEIIQLLEELQAGDDLNEGTLSLLSSIEEEFLTKASLSRMAS